MSCNDACLVLDQSCRYDEAGASTDANITVSQFEQENFDDACSSEAPQVSTQAQVTCSEQETRLREERRKRSSYTPSHVWDQNDLCELQCQTKQGSLDKDQDTFCQPFICDDHPDCEAAPVKMHELAGCSERSYKSAIHANMSWRMQCQIPAANRAIDRDAQKGKELGPVALGNDPNPKSRAFEDLRNKVEKPKPKKKPSVTAVTKTISKAPRSRVVDFPLPDDWTVIVKIRKEGKSAGSKDKHFVSPNGKKFRSLVEVQRFLKL